MAHRPPVSPAPHHRVLAADPFMRSGDRRLHHPAEAKRLSFHAQRVLDLFITSPTHAVSNRALQAVSPRSAERIVELRQAGYDIQACGVDRETGVAYYRYVVPACARPA